MTPLLAPVERRAAPRPVGIEEQPRKIDLRPRNVTHRLALGRYQSPLRYPGAKSGLSTLIGDLITSARRSTQIGFVDLLVEPFAGGASTSLRLLGSGVVARTLLADADPMVAAFWKVAAARTDELVDRISDEYHRYIAGGGARAIERWDFWRSREPPSGTARDAAELEMGTKCLFLNRTTFSGILNGRAGPIGGRAQSSAYGIGCRFNLAAIVERLEYIGALYSAGRIADVWHTDWRQTLDGVVSHYKTLVPRRVVAYLDPPYLSESGRLYRRPIDVKSAGAGNLEWTGGFQHFRLAEYLRREMRYRWILSYDYDERLIADDALYRAGSMNPDTYSRHLARVKRWRISKRRVTLNYTASSRVGRGAADELLLTTLPPAAVPENSILRPVGGKPKTTRATLPSRVANVRSEEP